MELTCPSKNNPHTPMKTLPTNPQQPTMKIQNNVLISVSASDLDKNGHFFNDQVTAIADSCFRDMPELVSVSLPKVVKIGNYNFRVCNALVSFEAPLLAQIGNENFRWCNALVSFEAPLTTMGNYNFCGCNALTTFEAPLLAQIGNYNFRECNALVSFEAPLLAQIGNYNFRWCNALTALRLGKHKLNVKNVDSYCFVIEHTRTSKGIKIYEGHNLTGMVDGKLGKQPLYVAERDGFFAHGSTAKLAIQDLNFKIVAEKLKSDPITLDTELTVFHYRTITGACDIGVRQWMQQNGLPFKVEKDGNGNERTVEVAPIKAKDVLPLLRKSHAYGLEKLESLLQN
jgi:hypothetical protein